MDLSNISKKLTTTLGLSGGSMYFAYEILQKVLSHEIDMKVGLFAVVICVGSAALNGAVYTFSQGKIDLGKVFAENEATLSAAKKIATDVLKKKDAK